MSQVLVHPYALTYGDKHDANSDKHSSQDGNYPVRLLLQAPSVPEHARWEGWGHVGHKWEAVFRLAATVLRRTGFHDLVAKYGLANHGNEHANAETKISQTGDSCRPTILLYEYGREARE